MRCIEVIPIGEVLTSRNEKVAPANHPELPYIGLDAIEAHSMRLLGSKPSAEMKSAAKLFYPGDVLYSRLRPYLNKVWRSDRAGICSSEFIVIPGNQFVDSGFLALRLNALDFVSFASGLNTGDRPRIDFDQISSFCLPPYSLPHQRRIVTKIEELFSELDKGVENLTTARAQLETYRQAVLKHAFEGKLTADWREKNKDKLETPEQLLGRIKRERKVHHERQLGDWKAAIKAWEEGGKAGMKPARPKTPSELTRLNYDELMKLPPSPDGYFYTHVANIGELGRGKSKHRPRNAPVLFDGPYPFIQTGEVKAAGRIIREFSKTYSEVGLKQSKLWPKGTLCITIAANIAETAVLGFDGCFPDSIVGFTALRTLVFPEYVELFVKSIRLRIEAYAPATAQKNINLATLENLVVPFCSLEEQRVVIDRLEAILSAIERYEREIANQNLQAEALRQSILKQAFSGQLVPQDPNDEPASILLERIRAERAAQPQDKTRKRQRRKAVTT